MKKLLFEEQHHIHNLCGFIVNYKEYNIKISSRSGTGQIMLNQNFGAKNNNYIKKTY